MRDFNFKSNSIVIFLYVLENLSSFNQVFFPRCMHFFSQKYAIFLKNMQFFSKICNFSQKYAIFSQKICIGKCLKFSYTYKKNAIHNIYLLHYFSFLAYIVSGKKPILKSDISLGSGDALFTIRLFCPLFTLKVQYTY